MEAGFEDIDIGKLIERINFPQLNTRPEVIRIIMEAIRLKLGVRLKYRSLSHPNGSYRILYPHILVDSGFRWHIRAYCDKRKDFRDFNLSRIADNPVVTDTYDENADPSLDSDWNTIVELVIKANPLLSNAEQGLIESEFNMRKAALIIKTRGSLVPYVLQTYQVNTMTDDQNPRRDRLILSNKDDVASFTWEA